MVSAILELHFAVATIVENIKDFHIYKLQLKTPQRWLKNSFNMYPHEIAGDIVCVCMKAYLISSHILFYLSEKGLHGSLHEGNFDWGFAVLKGNYM